MDEHIKKENIARSEETEEQLGASEKRVRRYQTTLLRLIALLAVVWLMFFVFLGLLRAPNNDMYPRIDAGDMILYYRLDKDVHAQDVIVLQKEIDGSRAVTLGRVVAAGGDVVDVTEDGRLVVNGNTIVESGIYGTTRPYDGSSVEYPLTLGEDECFVLADSREGGMDSRYFGAVAKSEIAGTVVSIWRRVNL